MKALRAADDSSQGLDCHPRHVVQWLLRCETYAGHLCVEPEHFGFWVLGLVPLFNQVMP